MFDGVFKQGKFHRGKLLSAGKYFYFIILEFKIFFNYLLILKLIIKMEKSYKIMNDKKETGSIIKGILN